MSQLFAELFLDSCNGLLAEGRLRIKDVIDLFRRKQRKYPLPKGSVIGHRGSCQEGLPENTLCSFLDAVAAGVDIVELDVWLTKDKQIVVFHDDDLSRMTACAYKDRINDMRYADLPEIVPGILQRNRIADVVDGNRLKPYLTEEVKSRIKASKKSTDYLWSRIPLFEEVLAVLPEHIGIIIEVKDHQPEMIPLLHALIRKQTQARQNNLFWFSLQPGLNSNLRSFDASVPCITSLPNILRVLMCYALGIAPFIDLQCDVFGIDCRIIDQERVDNEKSIKSLPQWAKNLIAYLFQGSPPQLLLLPYLYAMLRKKGVPVFFLGVDSIQFLHTAMRNGASAVLTDKPNMICAYMNAQRLGMNEVSY